MSRHLKLGFCLFALSSLAVVGCEDELEPTDTADASVSTPVCGDGTADTGEECDDGNNVDGDGCSSECAVEPEPEPDPVCGDGNVDPGEECDGTDDCDAACKLLPTGPAPTLSICPAPADACEECTCDSCSDAMSACDNLEGTATEGPAAGSPKAELCQAVVACGRDAGCRGSDCFCGAGVDLVVCLTGGAEGPCKEPIFAAAETQDPAEVSGRQSTPGYAIAAANAVSTCAVNSCTAACQ